MLRRIIINTSNTFKSSFKNDEYKKLVDFKILNSTDLLQTRTILHLFL